MKIAFDFGGVISHQPESLNFLAGILSEAGHKIYVLTGDNLGGNPENRINRVKQLEEKGFKYDELIVVDDSKHTADDKQKGKVCKQERIDLMFDDGKTYIGDIKKYSPETKTIKIDKDLNKD